MVGQLIRDTARPRLPFGAHTYPYQYTDETGVVEATGARSWRDFQRTASLLWMSSDGHEARFNLLRPGVHRHNYIEEFPRLSPHWRLKEAAAEPDSFRTEHMEVLAPPPPDLVDLTPEFRLLIAPWRNPEMLGQAVLNVFRMVELRGHPEGGTLLGPRRVTRRVGLHHSAREGDPATLPSRLRTPDPRDSEGTTPLMVAAAQGHAALAEGLLAKGANSDLRDRRGRTALHHAAAAGSHGAVQVLAGTAGGVDPVDEIGRTPLHEAAAGGHAEVVKCLQQAGADPNAPDECHRSTPLHLAARAGHAAHVAVLVGASAHVDPANAVGRTPLHVAAAYGHAAVVAALLEAGAAVNARDSLVEVPLHSAAFYQHTDCMALLIRGGGALYGADAQGNTPLHVAACMNRATAAEQLLEAGADLEARNGEGHSPLDLAIINPHFHGYAGFNFLEHNAEAAAALAGRGATIDPQRLPIGDRHVLWLHLTPTGMLHTTGDVDDTRLPEVPVWMLRELRTLNRGPWDPWTHMSVVVFRTVSLLGEAMDKNLLGLVQRLLDTGASPMTGTRNAMPPLHRAVHVGNHAAVELLLAGGADLEMPDCNSRDRAYDTSGCGRYGINQKTALDLAIVLGDSAMPRFLLQHGAAPPVSREDVRARRFLAGPNRHGKVWEGSPSHSLADCPDDKQAEIIAVFEEFGLPI